MTRPDLTWPISGFGGPIQRGADTQTMHEEVTEGRVPAEVLIPAKLEKALKQKSGKCDTFFLQPQKITQQNSFRLDTL